MGILPDGKPPIRCLSARAHPRRHVEATGRRMALLGRESGSLECWMWPIKVCHDIALVFRRAGEPPVRGTDIASRVEVWPEGFEITYVHATFTVRQQVFAAIDERAALIALSVELGESGETREPLSIDVELACDFVPMWPAGLGGQICERDRDSGALVLTEELGRFACFLGSPDAASFELHADHALAAGPITLSIPVTPVLAARGPIPFLIAGAELEPRPLSESARLGLGEAARGFSRSHEVVSAAREAYSKLARGWPALIGKQRAQWQSFLERTVSLSTSDARLDEAFEWAKIAIEKCWVEVDGVGKGLVAGLAQSGASARPGFGWFFDGDALTATRAMAGYGDAQGAREVFRFAAAKQRADGKLMHELVLSARLCNWTLDYPYAWYKAGNTPAFIATLDHHLCAHDDRALLDGLWPAIERALDWCESCLDEEGCLSNAKAGLAAVEAGPLVGRIQAETYLNGIWLSALKGALRLSRREHRADLEARCVRLLERAERGFERFWNEDEQRYGFAALSGGERCDDLSAYTAHPMSRGHGGPQRREKTVDQLNHPELATEWGVRMFSTRSSVYDPASYNTGSVFPYLSNFAVLAEYEAGNVMAGGQLLASLVSLHGFSGLGFIPEHLRGDRAVAPERGVPHQIFSSAALIQSVMYGMLGLSFDEPGRIRLRPALPPYLSSVETQVVSGGARAAVSLHRYRENGRTRYELELALREGSSLTVALEPRHVAGTRADSATVDGDLIRGWSFDASEGRLSLGEVALRTGASRHSVEWTVAEGPQAKFGSGEIEEGASSSALRILSARGKTDRVTWRVAGRCGRPYAIDIRSDRRWTIADERLRADPEVRDRMWLELEGPPGEIAAHVFDIELLT